MVEIVSLVIQLVDSGEENGCKKAVKNFANNTRKSVYCVVH